MIRGGWFFLGIIVGAAIVLWFDHKETIKALYNNREVIDKGTDAASHAQALFSDVKDIISQVRANPS